MRTAELLLCVLVVALLAYLAGREHARRRLWMAAYALLAQRYMRLLRVALHRPPPGSRQEGR